MSFGFSTPDWNRPLHAERTLGFRKIQNWEMRRPTMLG